MGLCLLLLGNANLNNKASFIVIVWNGQCSEALLTEEQRPITVKEYRVLTVFILNVINRTPTHYD